MCVAEILSLYCPAFVLANILDLTLAVDITSRLLDLSELFLPTIKKFFTSSTPSTFLAKPSTLVFNSSEGTSQ